ncbi:Os05g0182550, partial [Oryza sativa Japonica Group]
MKHPRNKSHCRWLVRIIFSKLKCQLERTWRWRSKHNLTVIPKHYIVVLWGPTYASWRILHQSFEIPHQPLPCWRRH